MPSPVVERGSTVAPRRVGLPGSGVLTVRGIVPGDRLGLRTLYGSLSETDRYLRFFTGQGPPKTLVEDMTRMEERGGLGLVAIVEGPGVPARLVGEATYGLLPNGNGELGITVDGDFRGWLGPFLLDVLCEEASARGIRNLEAQVLATNRPMLSVLRHRGMVYVDCRDPATAHVAIATRGKVPGWPPVHRRPRVLVEIPGGRWPAESAVREAGFEVLSCPGPRRGWDRCPALRGERCPLVDGADLVVDALPGERGAALLEAHRASRPTVPVCLVVADPLDDGDAGVERIPRGSGDPVVVAVVQRLARTRGLTPRPCEEGTFAPGTT